MQLILREILAPLARRAGTGTSAFLVGVGVESQSAEVIAAGVVSLVLVLGELAFSAIARRNAQAEVMREFVRDES